MILINDGEKSKEADHLRTYLVRPPELTEAGREFIRNNPGVFNWVLATTASKLQMCAQWLDEPFPYESVMCEQLADLLEKHLQARWAEGKTAEAPLPGACAGCDRLQSKYEQVVRERDESLAKLASISRWIEEKRKEFFGCTRPGDMADVQYQLVTECANAAYSSGRARALLDLINGVEEWLERCSPATVLKICIAFREWKTGEPPLR